MLIGRQPFFKKESTRGFIFAFVPLSVLRVVEELINTEKSWYAVEISSIFGAVTLFAA